MLNKKLSYIQNTYILIYQVNFIQAKSVSLRWGSARVTGHWLQRGNYEWQLPGLLNYGPETLS
jgi:hypothetical protein